MATPGLLQTDAGLVRRLAEVHLETDAELALAIRRGDKAAAARLYDRHATGVQGVVYRLLGPNGELDDIVQEVFIYALFSIEKLREPAALKSWLYAIAVGKVRGHLRKRYRMRWLNFFSPDELPEPSAAPEDSHAELARDVSRILEHLPPEERIALVVHRIEELPLHEAAKACSMSLSTFKRRLAKGEARFMARAKNDPRLANYWGGPRP